MGFLDDKSVGLGVLARVAWIVGNREQALDLSTESLTNARAHGHAITIAMAHITEAFLGVFGGEPQRAIRHANELVAYCEDKHLPDFEQRGRFYQGAMQARLGDTQSGIITMQKALSNTEGEQFLFRPMQLGLLASAHTDAGEFNISFNLLETAFNLVLKSGERFFEAELHRLLGVAFLAGGNASEAETSFCRSLSVARQQGARSFEMRTATGLAELWRGQGRHEEVEELIGSTYRSHPEGLPKLTAAEHAVSAVGG